MSCINISTKVKRCSETKQLGQNSVSSLTSAKDARFKGKEGLKPKNIGRNYDSSRIYRLRKKNPPATRFSNSWETSIKLPDRRKKTHNTSFNKDFFSSLPVNIFLTILSEVSEYESYNRAIALTWNAMVSYLRENLEILV